MMAITQYFVKTSLAVFFLCLMLKLQSYAAPYQLKEKNNDYLIPSPEKISLRKNLYFLKAINSEIKRRENCIKKNNQTCWYSGEKTTSNVIKFSNGLLKFYIEREKQNKNIKDYTPDTALDELAGMTDPKAVYRVVSRILANSKAIDEKTDNDAQTTDDENGPDSKLDVANHDKDEQTKVLASSTKHRVSRRSVTSNENYEATLQHYFDDFSNIVSRLPRTKDAVDALKCKELGEIQVKSEDSMRAVILADRIWRFLNFLKGLRKKLEQRLSIFSSSGNIDTNRMRDILINNCLDESKDEEEAAKQRLEQILDAEMQYFKSMYGDVEDIAT